MGGICVKTCPFCMDEIDNFGHYTVSRVPVMRKTSLGLRQGQKGQGKGRLGPRSYGKG